MTAILRLADRGPDVLNLQRLLLAEGFSCGKVDGIFGPATLAAVLGFQRSSGLVPDGIVGPRTRAALGVAGGEPSAEGLAEEDVTVNKVAEMFPFTRLDSIRENLPHIVRALGQFELMEKPFLLMALATVRAETESFEPVSEMPSRYNTSPGGQLFDLYDYRRDLGNQGPPHGERYRGRGFIQLTGRANYAATGKFVGVGDQLCRHPERANEPEMAATLLAAFLAMRRETIKRAMLEGDWRRARRLVNGGSHGMERFADALRRGDRIFADPVWPMGSLIERREEALA